ncbi:hypothetical protein HRD49_08360 [Corallococcus exiguus]|uniref:PKD domain-containing protein n=1 Tax=Corallococcus exiguus TaxID=83462 RepID=UPI00155F8639|nr:hypothetical protein [Corallococcus exiguus]NRD61767.1 hypothetical protein [Corallococcus exiguus]
MVTTPGVWGSPIRFEPNSRDPDGGPVSHRWSIVSKPSTSTLVLVNPNSANPLFQGYTEKDIGAWSFRLEVDDDEGEMRSFSMGFDVPNAQPAFEIAGASQVVVQKNIQLGVTNTHDLDGGELSFRWDILTAPAGASPAIQTGYSTQSNISIPTAGKEIGTWRFRVTGTDNEGASLAKEITVAVANIPPRIQISGATHVDEGSPIRLETTVVDDEDGGALTFKWEVVQAPSAAGITVPSVLSTSAVLSQTVAQSVPGTWIFRLTATDNENESVSKDTTVLLDGLPEVVFQNKPDRHIIGSGPLVLDASLSEDPDSPCPSAPNRCHLTDGHFVTVSPGITSYAWYISESASQPLVRVRTLLPQVNDSSAVLTIGASALAPGDWTFEVRITDGEGNEAASQVVVAVAYANTAPEARVSAPPVRPTVDLSGFNPSSIVVDGSQSIDPDNTFDGTPASPGLGITQFQWLAMGPPGCPSVTLPSGPDVKSVTLFPAAVFVPPSCQGRWQVTLTVTDDNEESKQATSTVEFSIGNCWSLACLDAPVPDNARLLQEDDLSGVFITTHLDSAFYDDPAFAMGTSLIMDVVQSGTSVVAFRAVTPTLSQTTRGLPLLLHWNGLNSQGQRLSGAFDIVLSVQTASGIVPAVSMGSRVILLEDIKTQVDTRSDTLVHREALVGRRDTVSFIVSTVDMLPSRPIEGFSWRVRNDAGGIVGSGWARRTASSNQVIHWDGRDSDDTLPVPTAGNYTFEAEAVLNGIPVGPSAPYAFTLYSVELDPVVVAPAILGEMPTWVHLERSVPAVDVTANNFTQQRLRMSPVILKVSPVLAGGVITLAQESGPSELVEIYEEGSLYSRVLLPKQWNADATPAFGIRLLAYGKGSTGDATFKMTYRLNGQVITEERVRFRMGPSPAAVGIENASFTPHFRELRTVNAGSPVRVALDRTRHGERSGRRADVYLVAHRDAASWALYPGLTDLAGGAKLLDVGGADVDPAILSLQLAAAEGAYDVVYDFGNFADKPEEFLGDGRLDPGDLLVSPQGLSAVDVEGSYVAAGTLPIHSFEYGGTFSKPLFKAHLPAYWDSVIRGGINVPLRGRAVYPVDMSVKRPLVMIAHGNHSPLTVFVQPSPGAPRIAVNVDPDLTSDENYRGYRYLQEHLAKRGFITVSIDLDGLYGNPYAGYPGIAMAGIQARAWVLLKNIELLLSNPTAVPAIAGKIEASRIYLMGHSRGGEAAIVAQHQLIQLSSSTPLPGALPPGETLVGLNPNNIKGIISLSPVSFAVESFSITPSSVPYLLIYGTADGDVNGALSTVRPFLHYDRAQGERFALRIEGANHNHFNTSWTASDASEQLLFKGFDITRAPVFDRKALDVPVGDLATLLNGTEQRLVATAYITAFLKMVDGGSRAAGDYFQQQPATLAPLGTPPGLQMYSQARLMSRTRAVLDDYESNPDVTLSSIGAPVASTLATLVEDTLLDSNPLLETEPANRFFQATRGALFSWSGAGSYEQTLPAGQRDLRMAQSLNFRAAQVPRHPLTVAGAPLSFRVELEDGMGRVESMSLGGFGSVPSIYNARIWDEPRYLDDGSDNPMRALLDTTSAAFKTFRLPIKGFAGSASDIDLGNIMKVRIRLAGVGEASQGSVALDDLEIEF